MFHANLVFVEHGTAPGQYAGQGRPTEQFVVTRHSDGSVASRYGDPEWDFTAYHHSGRAANVGLLPWVSAELTPHQAELGEEIRFLLFVVIWLRQGPSLSVNSIRNYSKLLRDLAVFADDQSIHIRDILSILPTLRMYLATSNGGKAPILRSLMKVLACVGETHLGYRVLASEAITALNTACRVYSANLKQHPPIPTRVYSELIGNLTRELQAFEEVEPRYLALLADCRRHLLMGKRRRRTPFLELLTKNDLTQYFADMQWPARVNGMIKGFTTIQLACKLVIQVYTGMRDTEANTLPFGCLEETTLNRRPHYRIVGTTTKLNGGKAKRAVWVTSEEGARAVRLAKRIASTIFEATSFQPKNHQPLFPSASHLGMAGRKPKTPHIDFVPSNLEPSHALAFFERILPCIQEGDLKELEEIDSYRAWRSDSRFCVGQPWRFSSHQLRRSLALYASRSGLVSLPSLRRQLQHITEEMSRYYAKGSSYAKDIIGGQRDHFALEWQKTQPESEAFAYIKNVLLSDERLFGGHGGWIQAHQKNGKVLSLEDRDKTAQAFRKGEMAYRETYLGGCTSVEACDKRPQRSVVACLDCSRTIIKLPKLQLLVKAQQRLVSQLPPDSMEWRVENEDLQVLIKTNNRLERQTEHAEGASS